MHERGRTATRQRAKATTAMVSEAAMKSGEQRRGLQSQRWQRAMVSTAMTNDGAHSGTAHKRERRRQIAMASEARTTNAGDGRRRRRDLTETAPPLADATTTRSDGRGPNLRQTVQRFKGLGDRFRGERDRELTVNRSRKRQRVDGESVERERHRVDGESGEAG
ncbi:hypothetical protein Scep_026471 [Stephania cephalantha]|uniref:Uncharacterized protein n=1 Tax=Stephania cephalantha TaxID=152367 RepID=A0AAP0END2_9MAGN